MPKFDEEITAASIEKRIPKGVPQHGMDLTADFREEIVAREKLSAPPIITVGTCLVCQHSHREFVERMLIRGYSYSSIARSIPYPEGSSEDSFRRSISRHYKKHMALEDAAIRAILEEEASTIGQDYEEGVQGAITARGMLQVALRRGFEDIQRGISTVEFKDMVQGMKLLREMDSQTNDTQLESYKLQVAIFNTAIKDVLGNRADGEEIQKEIVIRIRQLREKDEIETALEDALAPRRVGLPEAIEDAEVIE